MLAFVDVPAKHGPTNSRQIVNTFVMRDIIVSLDFKIGEAKEDESGVASPLRFDPFEH
jgi:hypothetical protein